MGRKGSKLRRLAFLASKEFSSGGTTGWIASPRGASRRLCIPSTTPPTPSPTPAAAFAAGRAGRRGFDTLGHCVILQSKWEDPDAAWAIIKKGPEALRSQVGR